MKYKVGDKIRIRNDLVVSEKYGKFWFAPEMSECLGKVGIIEKVFFDKSYKLDIYDEPWWTEEMIEGYALKSEFNISQDDLLEFLGAQQ